MLCAGPEIDAAQAQLVQCPGEVAQGRAHGRITALAFHRTSSSPSFAARCDGFSPRELQVPSLAVSEGRVLECVLCECQGPTMKMPHLCRTRRPAVACF